MKGFKDKDGKFHPITTYKGVRKSRDQSDKQKGVRLKRDPKPMPSTMHGGMFLFDQGVNIGNWQGDPSTRGMFDRWIHKDTGEQLILEINEDDYNRKKDEYGYEVWVNDEKGNHDSLFAGDYNDALKFANDWMRSNQRGWI